MADQLDLVIRYHEGISADARLYNRPSEGSLEEQTIRYLKELKEIKENEEEVIHE